MKKIIVAIDGYSSCGKSTLAKDLAKCLNYTYIDSGAMYRAVTHHFLQHEIDLNNQASVQAALVEVHIRFDREDGHPQTILNGQNVEKEIRQMAVSRMVSPVATLSVVRRSMVAQQQALGREKGIVMDGRDIGTVVFPTAELKIFLTADIDIRTRRRYVELLAKGMEVNIEEIQHNLMERDHIDSTRSDSPLRQAADAVVLDNSQLSREEQLAMIIALAQLRMKG